MKYIFTNVLTAIKDIMKANKILITLSSIIYAVLPCSAMEHKSACLTEFEQHFSQPQQVNSRDGYAENMPFLHRAIRQAAPDAVNFVLNQPEANIEIENRAQNRPLHIAMQIGNLQIAALLLQRGANVDAQGGADQNSPLHMAVNLQDEDQAREATTLILQSNPRPNRTLRNRFGKIPLHIAASMTNAEVVGLLLQNDPDNVQINVLDEYRNTPLHIAVRDRREGVVDVLTSQAAINPNIKDNHDDMPLHLALGGINPPQDFNPSLNIIRLLLRNRAGAHAINTDVNAENADGDTPLHLAAKINVNEQNIQDIIAIVEGLMNYGASRFNHNHNGQYPRDFARDQRVKALIDARFRIAVLKTVNAVWYGTVWVGRRTMDLTRRFPRQIIAVINHCLNNHRRGPGQGQGQWRDFARGEAQEILNQIDDQNLRQIGQALLGAVDQDQQAQAQAGNAPAANNAQVEHPANNGQIVDPNTSCTLL